MLPMRRISFHALSPAPLPMPTVPSTSYPSFCVCYVWVQILQKVGFDALNCIRLTSPSLAKGIIKYGSLLPGKYSTDANQRMGIRGGRSKNGER